MMHSLCIYILGRRHAKPQKAQICRARLSGVFIGQALDDDKTKVHVGQPNLPLTGRALHPVSAAPGDPAPAT